MSWVSAAAGLGRRSAIAWLAVMLQAAACAPVPPDAPRRTADAFCALYFAAADPAAALELAAGEAAARLEEEVRLLAGQPPPPGPVAATTVVARAELEDGRLVKFRVEVRVPPAPGAPRGSTAQVIPFDLLVEPAREADGAWRVTALSRG